MSFVQLKKRLFCLLFSLFTVMPFFSHSGTNDSLKGTALTVAIEDILQTNGFSATRKELSSTGQDFFACNLITDISPSVNASDNSLTMIICISQDDFYTNQEQILDLLNFVQEVNRDFPVQFVFTALDNQSEILSGYKILLQGTENYAFYSELENEAFAILLDFNRENTEKPAVFTAGLKKSSPLWLTREIVEAFSQEKIHFVVPQKIISLYRSGLLFGNEQVASFFKNDIPCIKVELNNVTQLSVIKQFIKNHSSQATAKNDVHYTFLTVFFKTIWVSEKANIIALEIFGTLGLLFLVCFTFVGKSRIKTKKLVSRYWFILPLMISVSLLSLYTGQFICTHSSMLLKTNPAIQLAVKILMPLIFMSVLFVFSKKLKLPDENYLYHFVLMVISITNIFVFSMADITLFWTFALEYCIVYYSRNAKKAWTLIASLALMMVPFLPVIAVYLSNVNSPDLRILINSSVTTNILICMIFLPMQIMWLQILLRLFSKDSKPHFTLKNTITYTGYSAAIIFGLLIILTALMTGFVHSKTEKRNSKAEFIESPALFTEIEEVSQRLPQLTTNTLKIKSEKQAVRYIVQVSSTQTLPVLDSLYSYSVKDYSKTAEFLLPDYPPQEISIDYSTENGIPRQVTVTAIYETDIKGRFIKERITKTYAATEGKK